MCTFLVQERRSDHDEVIAKEITSLKVVVSESLFKFFYLGLLWCSFLAFLEELKDGSLSLLMGFVCLISLL